MKQTLKKMWKSLRRVNGSSLAEFATVSALMATLAATAAPKLSKMSEGSKAEKSMNEIDKMLTQASNFYQATADTEGRGRFPGQEKYNCDVGDYGRENLIENGNTANATAAINDLAAVYTALETFDSYDWSGGDKWRSVFGITVTSIPSGHGGVSDDQYNKCIDCVNTGDADDQDGSANKLGQDEWSVLFNGNALSSKFQDGHFIYVVIGGGGSGNGSFPPVLVMADLENPKDYNNSLEP